MILQTISPLKKYNFSNELKLYLMNYERIDLHRIYVFPYNILVLVKTDDGTRESYVRCQETGTRFKLEAGNYYFVPAGLSVEYCLLPNLTYYTFHVGLEANPGIDLFSVCGDIETGNGEPWLTAVDEIYGEKDEFLALCRLRKTLLDFFIAHWPKTGFRSEPLPADFRELMQDVKTGCDATTTVESLAERMDMTPEAFSRKFRHLVSMTPKAFIMKCLSEKIIVQLCDSDKTLRQIAEELNFSSEFYCSRFFKKAAGISPAAYKKMVRANANH